MAVYARIASGIITSVNVIGTKKKLFVLKRWNYAIIYDIRTRRARERDEERGEREREKERRKETQQSLIDCTFQSYWKIYLFFLPQTMC